MDDHFRCLGNALKLGTGLVPAKLSSNRPVDSDDLGKLAKEMPVSALRLTNSVANLGPGFDRLPEGEFLFLSFLLFLCVLPSVEALRRG